MELRGRLCVSSKCHEVFWFFFLQIFPTLDCTIHVHVDGMFDVSTGTARGYMPQTPADVVQGDVAVTSSANNLFVAVMRANGIPARTTKHDIAR